MHIALEVVRWSSIALQLVAAVASLRLAPVSGRRAAWVLLSSGLVLITFVRLVPFVGYLRGGPYPTADWLQESLRLTSSFCLVFAVVKIGPYFRAFRDAETVLTDERNRARSYLNATEAIVLGLDAAGRVRLANRAAARLLGLREQEVLGADWFERFVPANVRIRERRRFDSFIASHAAEDAYTEYTVLTSEGKERLVAWHRTAMSASDAPIVVLSSGTDITAQRSAEQDLRFRSFMLDSATDSILVHDMDGRLVYVNEAAWRTRGWSREEMLALEPWSWVVDADLAVQNERARQIASEGAAIFESMNRKADGMHIPVEVHSRVLHLGGRELMVSVVRDISERKQTEDLILHMAFYDPLTGLANRTLFNDRLANAISNAERTGEGVAVLFLDVDHFKSINDTLGHPLGDRLLVAIADRLRGLVREGDTVARLGGDEFTLLLPRIATEDDAGSVARKVLEAIRPPFLLGNQEIHATASIGIALCHACEDSAEAVLKNADTAMYRAKENGRNAYQFFDPSMNASVVERFALKNDLRRVLERGELALRFQPQVRIADGRIVGAEALLRWQHPERGEIPPSVFVPLAEETGAILTIGEWVLREACVAAKRWHDDGYNDVRVAVNLSARQFLHGDLIGAVMESLDETGLPPSSLEIEITESIAMQNATQVIATFKKLCDLGVRIAIDDFGTGYSSLDRLKRFPIHTLKVAQEFMDGVGEDEDSAAIVTTIIVLAQSLKLNVVAEGVESPGQLDFLRAQGCNDMQGYLFSRAVTSEAFEALLRGATVLPDPVTAVAAPPASRGLAPRLRSVGG